MGRRAARLLPGHVAVALLLALLLALPAWADRLPSTVVPLHYALAFDVDLPRARFSGVETIRVTLADPSRQVVLNAADIRFNDATIVAGRSTQKATVTLNEAAQTATLAVPRPIPAGVAEIHIRYAGVLNDALRGFYLSQANGRRYAVTQFESTDARRAFPAFDEPAYKATFSIAVTIDRGDTAISNGRLLSDTPGPGANRHTLRFADTPKMSSYLVAMAVGDFQCLEDTADGIPIRVCATRDTRDLGRVALDAAGRILAFYDRYYTISYPFKKLDLVAIPDFAAGAMENTAAIFFREADLLTDAGTASVENMKRIWSVVAHEMAHQWFGDLVTMRWWDDLWLNEGFATWMETHPIAALRPEWRMDIAEVADTHTAMNLDALSSTRAIHASVETPDAIEGSFDSIAYEKGASVMRMLEGYLGADAFRSGINAYLEAHAFGSVTSEDFWRAMTTASGRPVDRILPTFVQQPGVPVIEVALACESGRMALTLTGRRFFLDEAAARRAPERPIWQVPICVKTPDTPSPICQVIATPRSTFEPGSTPCAPWAFVNAGAQGYFRTAYPPAVLRALAPDIATRLTDAERLSLVGDEWAMVRAGRHTVADYLTLVSGFGRERTSGVLGDIATRLAFVHDYLTTDRSRLPYERFVQELFGGLFDELGIDAAPTDDDERRALRGAVVGVLGGAGNDARLAAAARTAVDRALADGPPLDATAADAVIHVAARYGDRALWDRLLAASTAAASPSERYRYLYALTAFEDPALVRRGLDFALTPDLRSQDTPGFLSRLLASPVARAATWAFLKQHWADLAPKFTIALGDVRLVQGLGVFCDAEARDDIRSFFGTHSLPAAARAFDQTLERIDNCIATRGAQDADLTAWLASR